MVKQTAVNFALVRPGAVLPKRATPGSGAFDVFAPTEGAIEPHSVITIKTGVIHQVTHEAFVLGFTLQGFMIPRSGLATKYGIRLFYEGLVDNDYRGEIHITLENTSDKTYFWQAGERLCQIAYVLMYTDEVGQIDEKDLSVTWRGQGGFGHTGR